MIYARSLWLSLFLMTLLPALVLAQTPVSLRLSYDAAPGTAAGTAQLDCPATMLVGQSLQFNGFFSNTGTIPIDGVYFEITVNAPMTITPGSASRGTWNGTSQQQRLTIGTVNPGEVVTFDVVLTAVASGTAALQTVFGDSSGPGASDGCEIEILEQTELTVKKVAFGSWALPGEPVLFLITVTNPGSVDAVGVSLVDDVPDTFEVTSVTTTQGTCDNSPDKQQVQCALGTIPFFGSVFVEIATTTTAPHPGHENQASATALNAPTAVGSVTVPVLEPEGDADNDGVTNGDERLNSSDALTPDYTDIEVVKRGPALVSPVGSMQYEITVTNNGNPNGEDATVEEIELDDRLPQGVEFVSASDGCTYDASTRVLKCAIGPLQKGESKIITLSVTVNQEAGTEITNTALALGVGIFDVDNLNNIGLAYTQVVSAVTDLSLVKISPDSVVAGQQISFELTASNAGPDPATDVKITDTLTDGLTFSANGSSSECSGTDQVVTCMLGTLGAGESKSVTLVATVAATVANGTSLSNTAQISGADTEINLPGNDESDPVLFTVTAPCNAYVLIGDFNGEPGSGYTGRIAVNAAAEAQSDYEKAGYTVIRKDQATRGDFQAALQDPHARAIWFMGHGAYDTPSAVTLITKLFGTPEPGLGFTNGYIEPRQLGSGPFPNIEQVTLHACGQDLPEWRTLFPTAVSKGEFDAWSSPTRGYEIFYWQLGATYPRCSTASDKKASATNPPPVIHSRLWQDDQFHALDTTFVYSLAHVTNTKGSFVLNGSLRATFDGSWFNVLTRDTSGTALLFAAQIEDGTIPVENQSADYASSTRFDVEIDQVAFETLLIMPSSWPDLVADGSVTFTNVEAGLDVGAVVAAVGTLLWGEPYAESDLSLSLDAPESASVGDMVTFAASVTNLGPAMVGSPELVMLLPEGLVMMDPDCEAHHSVESAYVCPVGELAVGATTERRVDMMVSASTGKVAVATLETTGFVRALGHGERDDTNNQVMHGLEVVTNTSVDLGSGLPSSFVLHPAYPNPFNPQTVIRYELPQRTQVRLTVFDTMGRKVTVLVDEVLAAGRYETTFEAKDLPSGVYLYRLEAGVFKQARTMLLVK